MNILVAENEEGVMETIDLLLTTEGNRVTKAMDGEECLKKLATIQQTPFRLRHG